MKKLYISLLTVAACQFFAGCCCKNVCADNNNKVQSEWRNPIAWFKGSLTPDTDKVDVFYIVSTNVVSAKDSAGNISMRSLLTDNDKKYIDIELQFVKDSIFKKEFNFISPYYHQYTFDCFSHYPQLFEETRKDVGNEVCTAFDYYINNINKNRRFILAGFSQGGEMVMNILRHMTKEQYSRMVAAYVMGYKVTTADTTNYATIRPAKGETDTGVTISFNSVLSKDGIWDGVSSGTVACINPVTWTTDTTTATFMYDGRPHRVHINKQYNVLFIDTDPTPYYKWMTETPPFSKSGLSKDCLHHWDILFYDSYIHDNAVKRCK